MLFYSGGCMLTLSLAPDYLMTFIITLILKDSNAALVF